jgi:hypothetical protein
MIFDCIVVASHREEQKKEELSVLEEYGELDDESDVDDSDLHDDEIIETINKRRFSIGSISSYNDEDNSSLYPQTMDIIEFK